MTDPILVFPLFVIVGVFTGILTMLYGLGGGIVLVPLIYIYLHHLGSPCALEIAVGTSLLNVFAATLSATYYNQKNRNIRWPLTLRLIPGVIIGTGCGLLLSHYLKGEVLRGIFILFLMAVIINSVINKKFKQISVHDKFIQPAFISLLCIGFIVGGFSVLVGIGGGLMLIPYFRHLRMSMAESSATSASIAALLALCGTFGYIYLGHNQHGVTLPFTFGFVNVLIFIAAQIGSLVGIHLGEKIGQKVNDQSRAKWFPVIVGLMMVLMFV